MYNVKRRKIRRVFFMFSTLNIDLADTISASKPGIRIPKKKIDDLPSSICVRLTITVLFIFTR